MFNGASDLLPVVLGAFYEATGGSRWRNNRGWMSAAPLSEWEEVTVDASGRVTTLSRENRNLSGNNSNFL